MQKCVDIILKTLGKDKKFAKEFNKLKPEEQARVAEEALETLDDAGLTMLKNADIKEMDRLARGIVNNKLTKAMAKKRGAMLDAQILRDAVDFIKTEFADDPSLGLTAFLVGINSVRQGSRSSVAARQTELEQAFTGALIRDLEEANLLKAYNDGRLDKDVARALYKLRQGDQDAGKSVAGQIATIVQKHQEHARKMANDFGATIGYLPAYIARQTHDVYKIRKVTKDEWVEYVIDRVDHKRTFKTDAMSDEQKIKMLGNIYNDFVDGSHMHGGTTRRGNSNLAKRMSQERILHFKDADSWLDYNTQFGGGSLRESIADGFAYMAQNIGLLQKMGTNPSNMFTKIKENIGKTGQRPEWAFNVVTGLTRVPADATVAKVSNFVRAVQNMAKLGGAVVSALADIPLFASEVNYGGGTLLGGYAQAIKSLTTRTGADKKEIARFLGIYSNTVKGKMAARFGAADDVSSRVNKWQNTFFKLNLLNWWTHTLEEGFALGFSNRLALQAKKGFKNLDDETLRYFKLYDIDEAKWNVIRQNTIRKADDGNIYLTPENIKNIDDKIIKNILGETASNADVRRFKYDLESRVREMIIDRSKYAVIQPDARTKGIQTMGTKGGTWLGEFMRFSMQFKSFPIAVLQKAAGREIHGKTGNMASALGIAHMVIGMTIFGYMAMTAKDMLRGKTPRDPRNWKTFFAASLQGGALGIYGDFLFRDLSHYGGGLISTAAGPTATTVDSLAKALTSSIQGDPTKGAKELTRTIIQNIPFINLFYTRTILDYLILHQIYEQISPNYMRRMERRLERDYGQEFFLPPSSVIPKGGNILSEPFAGVR